MQPLKNIQVASLRSYIENTRTLLCPKFDTPPIEIETGGPIVPQINKLRNLVYIIIPTKFRKNI